jgi:TonB family protein
MTRAWLLPLVLSACAHPRAAPSSVVESAARPPSNEALLGTRAVPFAAYVTAMHRQIHKVFTLGFLADIDYRHDSAYADDKLWTQLEIVVTGEGSAEHVGIVRGSGNQGFDAAAIESVTSAAPFLSPPSVIRSADGKVHIDWQFHRDERACGTFGVDPHILTTPAEKIEHDTTETGAQASAMHKARAFANDARMAAIDPIRQAAVGWFAAYERRDPAWLAGWSATPFMTNGNVVARDGATLKELYRQMAAAAPLERGAVSSVEILTPAGIRGKLGGLPPGGEPSEMLFAVGKAGGDEFILLLKKSSQGWRVCGVDR